MTERPTLAEIAARLGLSKATVSRALSGKGRLATDTRRRVQDALTEAGYTPNRLARALSTGRTGQIGLVIGGNRTPVALSVMQGVVNVATAAGMQVVVHITATEAADAEVYAGALAGRSVDGVIHQFPSRAATAAMRALAARGTPVIAIDPEDATPGLPTLACDSFADGRNVATHLVERGHRRIGLVAETPGWGDLDRFATGFCDGLAAAGINPDPDLILAAGWTHAAGRSAVGKLLDRPVPPTGIAFCSDIAALGGLAELAYRGLSAPGDAALVGHDDTDLAIWLTPALTSLARRREGLAELATQRLLLAIGGEVPDAETELIAAPLTVRASSAPLFDQVRRSRW